MIPWFKVRLFHGTIWICRWRMNMLAMSQYQPRLSRIMTVAPGRSANQIVVLTSNKIFIYICNILFTIQIKRPLKAKRKFRRVRCKKCIPCTRKHCGKCKYFSDTKIFGDTGALKQCCEKKQCVSVSLYIEYTGKHVHAVTSIEQSPILKGHPFFVLS